ncbi:hypothetical protein [Pedobacter sp. CG_S7]|uniref:hypothetical protein n=1 Tax=Pedobacter sp. CG_S7 TaxID=3143930 RepID=UPI003392226B
MKLYQRALIFVFSMLLGNSAIAQDAVIIADGNFVRGTIQGTDFTTVNLLADNKMIAYQAKDIKEFLWNGNTFVSKPIVVKKRMEYRFFKLEEHGVVNLYAMGNIVMKGPPEQRARVMPSFGVGIGSGGYGGVGIGGGISIGGGGRNSRKQKGANRNAVYYIEKLGTGPLQEIPLDGNTGNETELVKTILLQKLSGDADLAERIKATDSFDAKNIEAFVSAYNALQK